MATKYIVDNLTGQTITGDLTIIGNLDVSGNYNLPYRTFIANVFKGVSNDFINNTTLNYDNFYSLKKGETYYINNYQSGDDFSNLAQIISGTMNQDYCIFKMTGDSRYYKNLEIHLSPYNWSNNSQLFVKGKLINEVIYNDFGYNLEWSYNYDNWWGYYGMTLSFPENIDPSKIEVKIQSNNDNVIGVNSKYFSTNGFRLECSNMDWNWGKFFDGTYDEVYKIEIQEDNKILVGGAFTGFYELPTLDAYNQYIFRLNSDGTRDETFMVDNVGSGYVGFNDYVYAIKIQNDSKILVGGYFDYLVDGTYDNVGTYDYNIKRIARLNSDGTRDESFLPLEGDGFNDVVFGIDVDGDGKILVTGDFIEYIYSGVSYSVNHIIRLNSDGSPDETFMGNVTGFTNNYDEMRVLCLDSGKYLVCGSFDEYIDINNTYSVTSLIRLNSDGTLDQTFNYTGFITDYYTANLYDVKVQNDGKIIVGGDFRGYADSANTYNDVSYLLRLTEDGQFDDTFYYDTGMDEGVNSIVWSIDITPEGKILIGGEFDQFGILGNGGNTINYYDYGYIIVLDDNGLPISDPGTGTNGSIYAIKYCGDKKFYAGGSFWADLYYNLYPFYNGADFWRFNIENDVKVTLDFDNYNYEYQSQSWNVHAEIKVYN